VFGRAAGERRSRVRRKQVEAAREGRAGGFSETADYLAEDARGVPAAIVTLEAGAAWGWPGDELEGRAPAN
jgi:hypothetical protein